MSNDLSLTAAAAAIASGDLSSERLVRDCLDRIEARDPVIRAWAFMDPELALAQARACDRAVDRLGPLHGVPIGIKDIIETCDMPTQMGSPIYDGNQTRNDAACVALMRAAGAVILGKTVTVEFAGMAPPPTRNPHNPNHTPGGSSSGSAAAVADMMVPAAFGTQTAGSVHRPAAYCGIIGYKPTFDTFNIHGVRPASQSLDTLGILARSLTDIELMSAVLVGRPPVLGGSKGAAPRIGFCRTHLWDQVLPETEQALAETIETIEAKGAVVEPFDLPDDFSDLTHARDVISSYERARATAWEWHYHRDQLSDPMQRTLQKGFNWDYAEYQSSMALAADARVRLAQLMDGFDALIAPVTAGEAPADLTSTGDHAFVGFWNLLHVPSFALPTHLGPNDMPVGVHLIGAHGDDARLTQVANWIMERVTHQHHHHH